MRRALLVAAALILTTAAPVSAQDAPDDTCMGTAIPCWVLWIVVANAALLVAVVVRTLVLMGRIRRGPDPTTRPDVPPELQDDPPRVPVRSFPAPSAPWPDEIRDGPLPRSKRRPASTQQVAWGPHRLWFDDGRYFFSDAEPEEDWLPCFQVPKGHRIVAGRDGIPRLERTSPRRPNG